jgi:hypothetical protein
MRSHPYSASLAVALLSTLTACGHAMTQVDRDLFEKEIRGQFSDKQFIVGFGEGRSRAEAEERARAQVAAAVKSEVQETLRAFDQERIAHDRSQATKEVTRELVSRVDTAFGAFILPRSAHEVGGTWQAAAAAERAGLDKALDADAQRRVREADALWRQLAAAKAWLEAAPAWCGAAAAASELDALHVERLAVSGRPVWTEDRLKLWTAASRRRAAAKSSLVIHVTAEPSASVENPVPALMQALQDAGWRAARGDASTCVPEGLVVDARLERDCRRSAIGVEVCKAAMVIEGRPCGAPQALFTERSPDAHATHSSDPEAAFRRAAGLIEVKPTVSKVVAKVLAVVGDSCNGAGSHQQ